MRSESVSAQPAFAHLLLAAASSLQVVLRELRRPQPSPPLDSRPLLPSALLRKARHSPACKFPYSAPCAPFCAPCHRRWQAPTRAAILASVSAMTSDVDMAKRTGAQRLWAGTKAVLEADCRDVDARATYWWERHATRSASIIHRLHSITPCTTSSRFISHRDSSWTLCGSVRKASVQLRLTSSLGTLQR